MSVVWTALVAAAVSAIVALVIEYAAKPGLEARKNRLLKERAELRELRRQSLLMMERDREGWTTDREPIDSVDRLIPLADQAYDQLHRCSDLLPKEVRLLAHRGLTSYQFTLREEGMPQAQYRRLQDEFAAGVDIIDEYVSSLGWWRWRRRKRIVEKARHVAREDE